MRNEILKMFKNPYTINSLRDFNNLSIKNNLIKQINEWWIEDNYELGLNHCLNKVYKIIISS